MPRKVSIKFLTKTIIFITLIFLLLQGAAAYAAEVTLQWDRPNDDRVAGYYIFYGKKGYDFQSAGKANIKINNSRTTSTVLSGLESGQEYEVAAKSFDDKGNESQLSKVVGFTAPGSDGDTDNSGDSTNDGSTDGSGTDSELGGSSGDDDAYGGGFSDFGQSPVLYHGIGFFHNGEFGTEYMNFKFEDKDTLSIEGITSSSASGTGTGDTNFKVSPDGEMTISDNRKGALSSNGTFFAAGSTTGDYPATTFGIQQSRGLTAVDFSGEYRVFLIKADQDAGNKAEIQKGMVSADGLNYLSSDNGGEFDFEAFYYVDDETGHLSLEPEGTSDTMDGALCPEGRIFAAVDTYDSDGTLLFIIGIRVSEDSDHQNQSGGGYYVNEFRYEDEDSAAGYFLELLVENNFDYDTYEIDSTSGVVREDTSGTLTVDETGLIQDESDSGQLNLTGSMTPGGEVLVLQEESLLGIGIKQSSSSSSGGGGGGSAGCFIGTLLP